MASSASSESTVVSSAASCTDSSPDGTLGACLRWIRRSALDVRVGGGGGGSSVQRTPAPDTPSTRTSRSARRRIDRKVEDAVLESIEEAADDNGMLSEEALDAIVRAIESRLLEAIDRRGGLWRGGF